MLVQGDIMIDTNVKSSCKNVFKSVNKKELKANLTEKWVEIIRLLEQAPKQPQVI
jgi:hypothetical protein